MAGLETSTLEIALDFQRLYASCGIILPCVEAKQTMLLSNQFTKITPEEISVL